MRESVLGQMRMRRFARSRGLTLVEVIIASLVVAIVAGGTMMAFIASANMTGPYSGNTASSVQGPQDLSSMAQANDLAQKTLESFRNEVSTTANNLDPNVGLGWKLDPTPLPSTGTASTLTGVKRCYRVSAATCASGEPCYQVQTQTCWNNMATCHC